MIVYILDLSESFRNPSGFCFRATSMSISLVCAHPSTRQLSDLLAYLSRLQLENNLKTSYVKQSIELSLLRGLKHLTKW